jgi:competence protein ComEC
LTKSSLLGIIVPFPTNATVNKFRALKLAHHGSHNGTDAPWLEMVKPELAIASVGKGNDYGHPSPQTLALLAWLGIPLLRTDQDGSVVIQSDGVRWNVANHQIAARGPPAGKVRSEPKVASRPGPGEKRINVNTATQGELEGLPGVGPVIARRIIEGRPYRLVDHLERVKRIGPKQLEEIRPLVTVE